MSETVSVACTRRYVPLSIAVSCLLISSVQHLGQSLTEDSGVSKVLESLVADNESLKRDSTELQHLLDETREELRTLQEEVEEHRASNSPAVRHRHQDRLTSSVFDDSATLASPFRVGTAPVSSMLSTIFASQQKAGPSSEKRASSSERFGRRAFVRHDRQDPSPY